MKLSDRPTLCHCAVGYLYYSGPPGGTIVGRPMTGSQKAYPSFTTEVRWGQVHLVQGGWNGVWERPRNDTCQDLGTAGIYLSYSKIPTRDFQEPKVRT